MTELRLRTVLEPLGSACAIVLEDEQVAALTTAKAFPVVVTIGAQSVRLRLARMGGRNLIGFRKEIRVELGVDAGDVIDAVITVDAAERTVEIPPLLAEALDADPSAKAVFDGLSFTRRKELARGIAEAKQEATRQRRLEKALDELRG